MKKIIHVNQHKIRANINRPPDALEPVLTCKTYKSNEYANRVEILDSDGKVSATVVYSPHKPLSCGARVWIETKNEINVIN
jgi:hypothetical protein